MYLLTQINEIGLNEIQAKKLINTYDHNQLQQLFNEILSQLFWFKKKASFSCVTKAQVAFFKKMILFIKNKLKEPCCPVEINENGLRIDRSFTMLTMYEYQEKLLIDVHWFAMSLLSDFHGYWINESTLEIICYVEGDLVTRVANNLEQLYFEKNSILKWLRENS